MNIFQNIYQNILKMVNLPKNYINIVRVKVTFLELVGNADDHNIPLL